MIKNNSLKIAMRKWLEAIHTKCQKEFVSQNKEFKPEDVISLSNGVPEYQGVRQELINDKRINEHFNAQIESDCFPEPLRLSPDEVLAKIPGYFLSSPVMDELLFERFYELFEKSFYSDDIEFQAVAPVQGLMLQIVTSQTATGASYDDDLEPFKLSDDLIIRHLKEEERKFAHNFEILRRYGQFSDKIYAFVATYSFKKRLVKPQTGMKQNVDIFRHQQFVYQKRAETDLVFKELENVLCLFKQGSINICGSLYMPLNFLAFSGVQEFSTNSFHPTFNFYPGIQIVKEERSDFLSLWNKFKKAKTLTGKKHLMVALRRYNYSRTRSLIEDKIIDLMIAAEVLTGTKNVRDISTSVAEFYGEQFPQDKSSVMDLIRAIYKMRSSIMHKGDLEKWSRNSQNRQINVRSYVEKTDELTRQILYKEIMNIN